MKIHLFHDWTVWEKKEGLKKKVGKQYMTAYVQERICNICKLIEVRHYK